MRIIHKRLMLIGGAIGVTILGILLVQIINLKKVKVVPVMDLTFFGEMDHNVELQGTITTNIEQKIEYDTKRTVKEIHVKEGDIVKKGDVLVTYDSTLQELELEMKQLDKQMLETKIETVRNDIRKLKEKNNNSPHILEDPVTPEDSIELEVPEEPDEPGVSKEAEDKSSSEIPEEQEEVEKNLSALEILTTENVENEEWLKGDGSAENPYVFLMKNNGSIKGDFFNTMMEQKDFFRIEVRENDQNNGKILQFWGQNGAALTEVSPEDYFLLILTSKNNAISNAENEIEQTSHPLSYRKSEQIRLVSEVATINSENEEDFRQQIREKEQEIEAYQLDLKNIELDLKKLNEELENQILTCSFDGVVKKVGDPNQIKENNEPLLLVTGCEGVYVVGEVPETQLNLLKKGTILEGNSYEKNIEFLAEIENVSIYPVEKSKDSSKKNTSMYTFTAYIANETDLKNNENVSVSLSNMSKEEQEGPVILEKAFVRCDNGLYYVYVSDSKGRLKKKTVTVSRMVDGTAYEITEGLSFEDLIAFPYGKWTKEGARTKKGSVEELYQ